MPKPKLLVNLPPGFFQTPSVEPIWRRLDSLAEVGRSSANTPEEIAPHMAGKEALIMWAWPALTAPILDSAPNLRFAGFLNVAPDTAAALVARGVAVSEAGRAWSPAVAELALTLVLNGLRRVSPYHAAFRDGSEQWVENIPADIDPRERQLTGRSVGIVGFGGIGQRLAELLAPFHTDLRIYDPYVPAEVASKLGARCVPLDELAEKSEVVVLAAANTAETERLFGARQLDLLPADAILVNVCRASVIDGAALLERLPAGKFTYLTDVYDREPLDPADPLRAFPNVFGTPHRAGAPIESIHRILTWIIDDLEAFLQGKPRKHAIGGGQIARIAKAG